MSNQFEFESAYYLASVMQYVSQDGRRYVVGPIWECAKQIDGEQHFPVVAAGKGLEGRVYWCRETSRGRSCRQLCSQAASQKNLSPEKWYNVRYERQG